MEKCNEIRRSDPGSLARLTSLSFQPGCFSAMRPYAVSSFPAHLSLLSAHVCGSPTCLPGLWEGHSVNSTIVSYQAPPTCIAARAPLPFLEKGTVIPSHS